MPKRSRFLHHPANADDQRRDGSRRGRRAVMSLKIVCSGYLIRYPLGGFSWHHLQYLVGLERLGHEVIYFEDYGWPNSCFDPACDTMTADPSYGIAYLLSLLR